MSSTLSRMHAPQPGPMYWDFRCLRCGEAVADHAPWWLRVLNWWPTRRYRIIRNAIEVASEQAGPDGLGVRVLVDRGAGLWGLTYERARYHTDWRPKVRCTRDSDCQKGDRHRGACWIKTTPEPTAAEWADYFEHWGEAVGSPPFTQEAVVQTMRGTPPFGKVSRG